jgi:hypothetical protein
MTNFNMIIKNIRKFTYIVIISLTIITNLFPNQELTFTLPVQQRLTITVVDSVSNKKIELVNLQLLRANQIIGTKITDANGFAEFNAITPGNYILIASRLDYKSDTISVVITDKPVHLQILLVPYSAQLSEIIIKSSKPKLVPSDIDIISGNQIVTTDSYHFSPNEGVTTFIQENVTGAVRQPVGEMVIRDQHIEYSGSSYYLDGVPVPPGVLGDLNEIISPENIQSVLVYTGGFPAEYGGQSSAVFDIESKIPTTGFHLKASSYIGSYLTSSDNSGNMVGSFKVLNSNGQSISFSNSMNKINYYIGGLRQESDRMLDQPVQNLFHDHGFNYFLYGKVDYILDDNNFLTSNLNYSSTTTQIPFDSVEAVNFDSQNSYNAFQTLSFYHLFSSDPGRANKILIALYLSERGLKYLTDYRNDETRQYLAADSTSGYTIDQNRKYFTYGTRIKYSDRLSDQFEYETGFRIMLTNANESFYLKDANGNGPVLNSVFPASDFGIFFQTRIKPIYATLFEIGARYDQSISPSIPIQRQFSPRIKFSWYINDRNTFYISYDRLFIPTNVEGLNYLSQIISGAIFTGTYPERDNLYEAGIIHNFGNGAKLKLDYFHKDASPGLDDESLGASSIKINVNIENVKVSGLELSLAYDDITTPYSFYINGSIIHGYGKGLISGGFFPSDYAANPFDLDHDQRLTMVSGINYKRNNLFASLVVNYGSGLTNGNDDYNFETGVFDLNQGAHTTPAWILNLSAGYTFHLSSGHTLEPSLYLTNLFDHSHLIKGAFFNSAYFEARRNVTLKFSYEL